MSLLELIGRYTDLRPTSSGEWRGRCPLPDHIDEHPSFYVNPQREVWFCFGCGRGGGEKTFKRLMGIRDERTETVESITSLLDVLRGAQRIFHERMKTLPPLATRKMLSTNQRYQLVTPFLLGFADEVAFRQIVDKFDVEAILRSGLGFKFKDTVIPMFRNRVTIPIFDLIAKEPIVVGFAARAVKDEQPKYLNTPETALFRKREILFLLPKSVPAAKAKQMPIYVVEGYFDAMRMLAEGFPAVAVMGSSLTLVQARRLEKERIKRIVLCFDGDDAGYTAIASAASLLLSLGFHVEAVLLPEGLDPEEVAIDPKLRSILRKPIDAITAIAQAIRRKPQILQRVAASLPARMFEDVLKLLRSDFDRAVLAEAAKRAKQIEEMRYRRKEFLSENLRYDEPALILLWAVTNGLVEADDPRLDLLFPVLPKEAQDLIASMRNNTVDENTSTASLYARLKLLPPTLTLLADVDAAFDTLFARMRKQELRRILEAAVKAKQEGDEAAIAELDKRWREIFAMR